jgi:predicted KAP-like P-loop ATPase
MKHLTHIKETLNAFLFDKGMSVIAISGRWGVGKTYFWNNFTNEIKLSATCYQVAYSYVSLFGVNSI